MKKTGILFVATLLLISMAFVGCKKSENATEETVAIEEVNVTPAADAVAADEAAAVAEDAVVAEDAAAVEEAVVEDAAADAVAEDVHRLDDGVPAEVVGYGPHLGGGRGEVIHLGGVRLSTPEQYPFRPVVHVHSAVVVRNLALAALGVVEGLEMLKDEVDGFVEVIVEA